MESEAAEEIGGIEDGIDVAEESGPHQPSRKPHQRYLNETETGQSSGEYKSNPKKFESKKGGLGSLVGEKADTLDGSVVIIYHIDEAAGQVYLAFESKTEAYPIKEARGKLALFGGTTRLGESSPETASRELREEDPDSYKTLIGALKDNGRKVYEIRERVDGVPSWTSVYAAEIKDPAEWEKYALTKTIEGPKRILTLEETLLAGSRNEFAFSSQGDAVYIFITKGLGAYLRR